MGKARMETEEKISAAKEDLDGKVYQALDEMVELLMQVDSCLYLDFDREDLIEFINEVWIRVFNTKMLTKER